MRSVSLVKGIYMDIKVLELIDGAKQAEGLTVVIDVFRAFSLEAYLMDQGAERIYPIGEMEEAFAMKREHPDWLLFGERGGAKVEGCDFGNSPSSVAGMDLSGRSIIHSTSAGTQGIVNAAGASEIITGSLVNAAAVADYIRSKNPETVSLCAMGNSGVRRANEDILCAEYIKSMLLGQTLAETLYEDDFLEVFHRTGNEEPASLTVQALADELKGNGGEHFFDPGRQHIYPKADFELSTRCDVLNLVIRVTRDAEGRLVAERIAD